jgi:DNA-binding beta-propeller fold protein YncE
MKKGIVFFLTAFFLTGNAYSFTLSNFDSPESIVVDPEDGSYYVSCVNGNALEKDGNGYISKISSDRNIIIQKYIGAKTKGPALHSPKGLAIAGKIIYVTDIDAVKGFDKEKRALVTLIDFSKWEVKDLNDLTIDDKGDIFVSDRLTNRIFKIEPAAKYGVSLFKAADDLAGPNGLLFNPRSKNLMVVTWRSGQILEIDRQGGIHSLKRGLTTLDGIDFDKEGNLYVSSFDKGEIYKIAYYGRGALTTALSGIRTPSDISYDRKKKELLIPQFNANKIDISAYPVLQKKNLKKP